MVRVGSVCPVIRLDVFHEVSRQLVTAVGVVCIQVARQVRVCDRESPPAAVCSYEVSERSSEDARHSCPLISPSTPAKDKKTSTSA